MEELLELWKNTNRKLTGNLAIHIWFLENDGLFSRKVDRPLGDRDSVISHVHDLFKCSNLAQNSVLWMSSCVQNLVRRNRKLRELLADSVDL